MKEELCLICYIYSTKVQEYFIQDKIFKIQNLIGLQSNVNIKYKKIQLYP